MKQTGGIRLISDTQADVTVSRKADIIRRAAIDRVWDKAVGHEARAERQRRPKGAVP